MTGRPREFDRSEALDEAMNLFWSQGYEATGVSQLCERMGVGRQSLYNTFGDKEALFAEALARYRELRFRPMVEMLRRGAGLDGVTEVLDAWVEANAGDGSKGCLMANSIAEFGAADARVSQSLTAMLAEVEGAFEEAFERAQRDGALSGHHNPKALARFFTTLGQGLSTVGKLESGGQLTRDAVETARAILS